MKPRYSKREMSEIQRIRDIFKKTKSFKVNKEKDFNVRLDILKNDVDMLNTFEGHLTYVLYFGKSPTFTLRGKLLKTWVGIDTIAMAELQTRSRASHEFKSSVVTKTAILNGVIDGRYTSPEITRQIRENYYVTDKVLRNSDFIEEIKERTKNVKIEVLVDILFEDEVIYKELIKI